MYRGILSLLVLVCALPALAAPLTSADTVNIAGRQRMLSQRIVKAYAQIGAKVQPEQSQRILSDSLEQFSRQLDQLRPIAERSGEAQKTFADIERVWPAFKLQAGAPPNREKALDLYAKGNELQKLAHQLANQLEARSDNPVDRIVNLAGRQRMLTQQLAKAYMLRAWNFDTPSITREMETAQDEFAAAVTLLTKSPLNTPEIRRELDSLVSQWEWFQVALEMEGAFSYRLLVADASETILNALEKLVTLYARLGRR